MSLAHTAYISLGSNSLDAGSMLAKARAALQELGKLTACSPVYETEPQGYTDQPWFHNQVAALSLEDHWNPRAALRSLLQMEKSLGRKRGAIRFGPRNIDLDLLLFDDVISQDPHCSLPHPRLHKRAFVLVPLRDIAPELLLAGKSLTHHLDLLPWHLEGMRIFQNPEYK